MTPASRPYVKNGEIVLNISSGATRKLTIDNERVQFTARFNGVSQEVSVPVPAVSGIFAKETGYGFAFTVNADPVASLDAATAPTPDAAKPAEAKPRGRPGKPALPPSGYKIAPRHVVRPAIAGESLDGIAAGIAQQVEQRFCKPMVLGSIPTAGTTKPIRIGQHRPTGSHPGAITSSAGAVSVHRGGTEIDRYRLISRPGRQVAHVVPTAVRRASTLESAMQHCIHDNPARLSGFPST